MKKLICFLLSLLLLLSCTASLSSCKETTLEESESTKNQTEKKTEETTKWLLPTTIKDSHGEFDLHLTWEENSCQFEADGNSIRFLYDPEKRSLSVQIDGSGQNAFNDLCIFDSMDRISALNFDGSTVLTIGYNDSSLNVLAYGEDEPEAPVEISADWTEKKILMPPFDDPDDYLRFTEWGDLVSGEETTLYQYEYDDKGNLLKVQIPQLGDYSWTFTYGDEAMTHSWQRAVVKFMLIYSIGRPFNTFAMDMLCFAAYQQHSAK